MAEKTIKAMLARAAKVRGDAVALRFKRNRSWETMSYNRLLMRSRQVSEILNACGVKAGDRVGLLRENAPEWPEIYLGITGMGAIAVPLETNLQEQDVAHILRRVEAHTLVTDARHYQQVREMEDRLHGLRHVILVDGNQVLPARDAPCAYSDYETLMGGAQDGALSERCVYDADDPAEDDVASIVYTSGTTARPKGAMLSHLNFMADVEGCLRVFKINPNDTVLLVLPLHHVFAFTVNFLSPLAAGAEIGFMESLRTMGESMAEIRPSILVGVPALFEKLNDRLEAGVRMGTLSQPLMKIGLGRLVGHAFFRKLGGRLRLAVSGGGSCDPSLLQAWNRLGLPIREGYGLTEAAPVVTFNASSRTKPGAAGSPLPGVEVKIHEPGADGKGEVLVRGDNVMTGYYKDPEATAAAKQDGWLHTGDLGVIDRNGQLFLYGRKTSLIIDREGRKIYPEEMEANLRRSPYILEALVLGYRAPGDDIGESVGAIVVPDQQVIDEQAGAEGKTLTDKDVEALVIAEAHKQSESLPAYARPRLVQVRFESFEKTSTLKIKRYLYAIDTVHSDVDYGR